MNALLAHPDLADLVARDGGRFALIADHQIKYGIEEHHRAEAADEYGTYLNSRVLRGDRWVTARPRITCGCGKNVAQRLDGTPRAHACTETNR